MTYRISVIVSTYNWPSALNSALASLVRQDDPNFEVIVADDGSTESTKAVVDRYVGTSNVAVRHVWHPDRGFRVAEIRNKAVGISEGDYLLFLDGDCLPAPGWLAANRKLAEAGWIVQGQRILLSQKFTKEFLREGGDAALLSPTLKEAFLLYLSGKINRWWPLLRIPLGGIRKVKPKNWRKIRTCNLGVWREDFLRVRGFDESFVGWGYEDADLAVRLLNAGVKTKMGDFSSVVFHLWHRLASRTSASVNLEKVLQREQSGEILPSKGMGKDGKADWPKD